MELAGAVLTEVLMNIAESLSKIAKALENPITIIIKDSDDEEWNEEEDQRSEDQRVITVSDSENSFVCSEPNE